MSNEILYSLRVYPNWAPAFNPGWRDVTDSLMVNELPSISIAAERADIPLVTVVSDLSLHLSNTANVWDDIFDVTKIVNAALPPGSGATLRAPLVHYGRILLCRKASGQQFWQVIFFGFVDPKSVRFNPVDKTIVLTAFAPGKILEHGNAERVNKAKLYCPARPFVMAGAVLTHPETPPGGTAPDNAWWKVTNAVYVGLTQGDQFKAIRAINTWSEGKQTIPFVNTVFNIDQVAPVNATDLLFKTLETPNLALGINTAQMELLNPWYRSRKWEDLVQDLIAEVNAAMVALGSPEIVVVANTTGLPLLPATSQLFAQLIYMADVILPETGVAYAKYGAGQALFISRNTGGANSLAVGKGDILAANTIAAVTRTGFSPGTISGYTAGPDDGLDERILTPQPNMGAIGSLCDVSATDYPFCGKDLHIWNNQLAAITNAYDSTRWSRTPTSWLVAAGAKRFYRIYARGRYDSGTGFFKKGIAITEFTTTDGGVTWTIASTSDNFTTASANGSVAVPIYDPVDTTIGAATRAEFKVMKLGAGSYLYGWFDPFKQEVYVKTAALDNQAASFFFPPPATFITAKVAQSPVYMSGFVTEGTGGAVWFFCDRKDRTGVDLYYWNGAAMAAASIVDTSGQGAPNLLGGDFASAIVDAIGPPPTPARRRIYVMVGKTLFAMTYSWAAPTLTITAWQAIAIDQVNFDPYVERQLPPQVQSSVWSSPSAVAWLSAPVIQNNAGEPDYTDATDALIVGTSDAIYIVSNVATNIVDIADFEGLSVAAALQSLIQLRGYQMLSGAELDFVGDPVGYLNPQSTISFKQRLLANPVPLDLTQWSEGAEYGVWFQNFVSVAVQNSRRTPPLGPFFNSSTLINLIGQSFTINNPRNPGSKALPIDNRFLTTESFCRLIANIYAQDFLVPQPDATVVVKDPYVAGLGLTLLHVLDPVKFLARAPDPASSATKIQTGRIFSIDYGLDHDLLTLKVG